MATLKLVTVMTVIILMKAQQNGDKNCIKLYGCKTENVNIHLKKKVAIQKFNQKRFLFHLSSVVISYGFKLTTFSMLLKPITSIHIFVKIERLKTME